MLLNMFCHIKVIRLSFSLFNFMDVLFVWMFVCVSWEKEKKESHILFRFFGIDFLSYINRIYLMYYNYWCQNKIQISKVQQREECAVLTIIDDLFSQTSQEAATTSVNYGDCNVSFILLVPNVQTRVIFRKTSEK